MATATAQAQAEAAKTQRPTPSGAAAPADRVGCREFYQTRDVVEILGISRRQLQYWAQTDLVVPSATTRGGHRRYSFEDLVALKAAKRLIDAGVSLQRIRKSIQSLRRTLPAVGQPLSELVLVATGDIVLVFRDGSAFEAVSGQEWVFEVASFERELRAWFEAPGAPAATQTDDGPKQACEQSAKSIPSDAARRGTDWGQTA